MLPEVQEYFRTVRDSNEYYDRRAEVERAHTVPIWRDSFNEEQRQEYYAAEKARTIAILEFEQEFKENNAKALDTLKNHADPVVRWLVTDRVIARDYTGYRDTVLRHLPMSREEMEEFGDQQGWCGDYARMLERAERHGVLPERTPELFNIDALVKDLQNWYGGSERRFRNTIKRHLPKIVEDYLAEKTKLEAAKAEETRVSLEHPARNGNTKSADAPRRRVVPVRNPDGTFAGSVTVAA